MREKGVNRWRNLSQIAVSIMDLDAKPCDIGYRRMDLWWLVSSYR